MQLKVLYLFASIVFITGCIPPKKEISTQKPIFEVFNLSPCNNWAFVGVSIGDTVLADFNSIYLCSRHKSHGSLLSSSLQDSTSLKGNFNLEMDISDINIVGYSIPNITVSVGDSYLTSVMGTSCFSDHISFFCSINSVVDTNFNIYPNYPIQKLRILASLANDTMTYTSYCYSAQEIDTVIIKKGNFDIPSSTASLLFLGDTTGAFSTSCHLNTMNITNNGKTRSLNFNCPKSYYP